jgi:hypothetical protein
VELGELHRFLLGESSLANQPPGARASLISAKAGICFLCIIYTYFRVPEPAGRSFAELDLLFERGVSARKFSSTKVDVFDETVGVGVTNTYDEKMDGTHSHTENIANQS